MVTSLTFFVFLGLSSSSTSSILGLSSSSSLASSLTSSSSSSTSWKSGQIFIAFAMGVFIYLLDLLGNGQLNRIRDEFRVLLDDILDLFLLEVFELVLLEVETYLGATTKRGALGIGGYGESPTSRRLPDVLFVIVVLGQNLDALGNEVGGVETDTELTNHGNIGTSAHSLHETLQQELATGGHGREVKTYLGSGLGNGTKVVDHVSFGHTDTGIPDTEDLVLLVGTDADVKLLFGVEDGGIGQGRVTDFVESIRTVGDQFTQKDLLIGVEGV